MTELVQSPGPQIRYVELRPHGRVEEQGSAADVHREAGRLSLQGELRGLLEGNIQDLGGGEGLGGAWALVVVRWSMLFLPLGLGSDDLGMC